MSSFVTDAILTLNSIIWSPVLVAICLILLLSPKAIIALRDYEKQKKSGKDPVFHPREIGIENADWWEDNDVK